MTELMTKPKPICKTVNCKQELTYLEKTKCWRCLICNPIPDDTIKPSETKVKYVDVKMTEKRVREIVQDELENWHIQKPSVTKDEVAEIVKPPDWRAQAKALGVPLSQPTGGARKKVDVLADIAAAQKAGGHNG